MQKLVMQGPVHKPRASNVPVIDTTYDRSFRRRIWLALVLIALLFGTFGTWAAKMQISGAIIAPGQVVVETNIKKVQHPTGGVVGEILVKSGDLVAKGDVLLRLDDTQTRASLAIVTGQMTELKARKARLAAERDGRDRIVFPRD